MAISKKLEIIYHNGQPDGIRSIRRHLSTMTTYAELTKGQHKPNRKITPEQIGEAVAQSVSHLPGVDTELVKQMFLAMAGTVTSNEKGSNDQ